MDSSILYALYAGSLLGAAALILMMPGGYSTAIRRIGALLGAASVGGVWLWLSRYLPDLGTFQTPFLYYYLFSALAIVAAVRVITHTKPVYSALWFVMVVLSSAGMLLILKAEFMAFALVIIYGGAILVTYVFVIMLAVQAGDVAVDSESPDYERLAREPILATLAGFLMLALLLTAVFDPRPEVPQARAASDWALKATLLDKTPADRIMQGPAARLSETQRDALLQTMPVKTLEGRLIPATADILDRPLTDDEVEAFTSALNQWLEEKPWLRIEPRPTAQQMPLQAERMLEESLPAMVEQATGGELSEDQRSQLTAALREAGALSNVERVGFDLFNAHPLGLELAGVILLVSLVGAVIMARQRVTPADEQPPIADEEVLS